MPKPDQLCIQAPNPRQDFETLLDLCCKTFGGNYFERYEQWGKNYFRNSNYDFEATRVGFVGEEMVTHVGVWDYLMRVGQSAVKTAGIGAVATDGRFRKRGLMHQTFAACVEAMREHGYALSILFGIPNFYWRYGYQRAWPRSLYRLELKALPVLPANLQLTRCAGRHQDEFAQLYNRYNAQVTGSAVRPTFRKQLHPFNLSGVCWKDHTKQVKGYLFYQQQGRNLEISDAVGEVEEILSAVQQLGKRLECDMVTFLTLPFQSNLARRLRRLDCTVETVYHPNAEALVAVINLPLALESIVDELTARLAGSNLAKWTGVLNISNSRESCGLDIRRGKIQLREPGETPHCLAAGDQFGRLLIGAENPGEIIEENQLQLTGDAARLVDVLFPAQYPILNMSDMM